MKYFDILIKSKIKMIIPVYENFLFYLNFNLRVKPLNNSSSESKPIQNIGKDFDNMNLSKTCNLENLQSIKVKNNIVTTELSV